MFKERIANVINHTYKCLWMETVANRKNVVEILSAYKYSHCGCNSVRILEKWILETEKIIHLSVSGDESYSYVLEIDFLIQISRFFLLLSFYELVELHSLPIKIKVTELEFLIEKILVIGNITPKSDAHEIMPISTEGCTLYVNLLVTSIRKNRLKFNVTFFRDSLLLLIFYSKNLQKLYK
jgi:hypothetical protein